MEEVNADSLMEIIPDKSFNEKEQIKKLFVLYMFICQLYWHSAEPVK